MILLDKYLASLAILSNETFGVIFKLSVAEPFRILWQGKEKPVNSGVVFDLL